MLYDLRDVELLRLAGRCRVLPYGRLAAQGFDDTLCEIGTLIRMGLISVSRDRERVKLTPAAYELLDSLGFRYTPGRKRAAKDSVYTRRRLEAAEIMLTCHRAGIDCTQNNSTSLSGQPVFFPAFELRPEIMNCANCAGFAHMGDTAFMFQYIGPESPGMYLSNELGVFTCSDARPNSEL